MKVVRNIFLTLFAALISVTMFCACHSAQASNAMDHSMHMVGQITVNHDVDHDHSSHTNQDIPIEEICSHCETVSEMSFLASASVVLEKPSETETVLILPTIEISNINPTYLVSDFSHKRWRPPQRPTPVSLKTRLLN